MIKTKCWILARPETPPRVDEAVEGATDEEVDGPGAVVVAPPLELEGETEVLEDAVVGLTPEELCPEKQEKAQGQAPTTG
jgi:hypothetical protein